MKQIVFNIEFILDVVSFIVIFVFPAPTNEVRTGRVVEDNTPMGDGKTAGEQRTENKKIRSRNKILSKLGFAGAIIGMALMWYSNGMPPQ
ncbi:MAG: hypothetical protein JRG74_03420 [Deltaproteobacteria bacterium]|nr:hypothetical protein [Deltaproteobacteria bacterium]MBW2165167.1 hypothetical protein [Deltaproteobacteria bacterium]